MNLVIEKWEMAQYVTNLGVRIVDKNVERINFKIRRVTAFSFIMLDKIATMMYRLFFVYRIRILFFLTLSLWL
ncbi:hypothetical protein MKC45_24475, partial [[Clostridium] innocuum]|nr:hypothetical protein [[Clostridium] innocuum]